MKKSNKLALSLKSEFEEFCKVGQKCVGCRYDHCETVVQCASEFFADKLVEASSCAGCIRENGGEGDEVCRGCCRNYEEDCFEVSSE